MGDKWLLLDYCMDILEKEIEGFWQFIKHCEDLESLGENVDSQIYKGWKSFENDIILSREVRKAIVVGYAWTLKNMSPWSTSNLVVSDGKKYQVNYTAFEEYIIRKFLPVTIGYEKPTIFIWNGKQYVENRGEIENLIKHELEPYFDIKQIRNHTNEIMYRVKIATTVRSLPFNLHDNFLPVKNGTLMLEPEYRLLPHSPAFGFTYCINANYDPNAKCEKIEKFISEVVEGEDQKVLYEIAAICLLDERYHYAYMLYGSGGNGKSTYLTILRTFLGEQNVSSMTFQELCEYRFAQAELFGKLANICADIPRNPVSYTGIFKMLTGGDMIKAEKKYRDPFYFVNRAKLIFSCNELPEVRDTSPAFWRRWIIVKFPRTFPPNPDLIKELTTEEELSGFLNKVLEARTRILMKGVSKTKTIEDVMREWMMQANPVWGFIVNCIVSDPSSEIPRDELYDAYRNFCEQHNLRVVSKTAFAHELQKYIKVGTRKKRVRGELKRVWTMIRLRCDECKKCTSEDEENGDYSLDSFDTDDFRSFDEMLEDGLLGG
jgi:putative DNA primase/helicase